VGEHRTLGGFSPVLRGEKVASGESIRDIPDTSKGPGETDYHDITDGLAPSGVDLPGVKDGPGQCRTPSRDLWLIKPTH
jgi:hypothetical protein